VVDITRMTWRAAGVMVAVLAATALRWSSTWSSGTRTARDQPAQIRLSLSARPERVERCRELSDDELAKLPAHMRMRTKCEGYSARYLLTIGLDEDQLTMDTLRGGGLRHDRPLHVFREYDVTPGRQRIRVEVTRVDEGTSGAEDRDRENRRTQSDTLLGGREEREREERTRRVAEAMPSRLVIDTTMTFVPGGVVLVTFDDNTRRLTMRKEP
jgi:hypothetical protein